MRAAYIQQSITPFAVREPGGRVGGTVGNFLMQGGVAGSPGTLPSGWSENNTTGMTVTHAYGWDRGRPYIDTRLNGTAVAGQAYTLYSPTYVTGATSGDKWEYMLWMAKIAGTFTNFDNCQIGSDNYTAVPAYINTTTYVVATGTFASGVPKRYTTGQQTITAASMTQMRPFMQWYFLSAVATDITIRVQLFDCVRRV